MSFSVKVVIAFCFVVGLITFVSLKLSNLTVAETLLRVVMVMLVALGAMALLVLVQVAINRFILRHGGIDTKWLWFKANPPGFDRAHGAEVENDPAQRDSAEKNN